MDFLDEIAKFKPVPAGGAACAYTANLGMALVYKVLLFEMNRKELAPTPQANLRVAQREIERIFLDLKKLIHDDPKCYEGFAANTRSGARAESKAAFLEILTCSMLVMEKAFAGLEWVRVLSKVSSPKQLPNLQVGADLLYAAIAGTAHVVRDNLKSIKSAEKRKGYLARVETLCEDAETKRGEVLKALREVGC